MSLKHCKSIFKKTWTKRCNTVGNATLTINYKQRMLYQDNMNKVRYTCTINKYSSTS